MHVLVDNEFIFEKSVFARKFRAAKVTFVSEIVILISETCSFLMFLTVNECFSESFVYSVKVHYISVNLLTTSRNIYPFFTVWGNYDVDR